MVSCPLLVSTPPHQPVSQVNQSDNQLLAGPVCTGVWVCVDMHVWTDVLMGLLHTFGRADTQCVGVPVQHITADQHNSPHSMSEHTTHTTLGSTLLTRNSHTTLKYAHSMLA